MAANQFESSRITGGTLNRGGQKTTGTVREVPVESDAISRNDARDGVSLLEETLNEEKQAEPQAERKFGE
jgi:hypothetical protein